MMIVLDGANRLDLRSGGDGFRVRLLARVIRMVVAHGDVVGLVCLRRSRASRRLLWVASVGRRWCVGSTYRSRMHGGGLGCMECFLTCPFQAPRACVWAWCGGRWQCFMSCLFLLRFVKGEGRFGVSRLSSFSGGRVGQVVRAALGACSCLRCRRTWWRGVTVCSQAYNEGCALQPARVVWRTIRRARAVVGLVGWWAFVSAACCRVCVSERVW